MESRFEARAATGADSVGRARARRSRCCCDRWQQAKEGEGQVVLLSRRAGDRQVAHDRSTCASGSADERTRPRMLFRARPITRTARFYPIIEQLERAAGVRRDDRPQSEARQAGGAAGASDAATSGEIAPLFAALLSSPTAERYPPLDLTPQRQKELTIEALIDQIERLARVASRC